MPLSFKQFSSLTQLTESSNPVHVLLTLQQVIDVGKITNTAQVIIMAQCAEALRHNEAPFFLNVNEFPAFSKGNIDAIKNLPPNDQVELAKLLISKISIPFEIRAGCADPTSSSTAWVNSVLQPQK